MKSNSRTVKGLNIAILIIAALGLVGSLFSIFSIGLFGAVLTDPYIQDEIAYELYYSSDLTLSETYAMISMLGGMTVGYMVVAFAASVVSLIAGILGVKNAEASEKLKSVFVLTIVGIVLNVFALNIVLIVLMIISAVFISKTRKEDEANFYGGNENVAIPVYGQQAQPMPVAAPTQPAPVTAPAQPAPPTAQAVSSVQPSASTQASSSQSDISEK